MSEVAFISSPRSRSKTSDFHQAPTIYGAAIAQKKRCVPKFAADCVIKPMADRVICSRGLKERENGAGETLDVDELVVFDTPPVFVRSIRGLFETKK